MKTSLLVAAALAALFAIPLMAQGDGDLTFDLPLADPPRDDRPPTVPGPDGGPPYRVPADPTLGLAAPAVAGESTWGREGETLHQIAARVYGDERYWFLVYRTNQDVLDDFLDPIVDIHGRLMRPLLLRMPPHPRRRIHQQGGRWVIRAIPGDTFQSIALASYGSSHYWRAVYEANRSRIPSPTDPFAIFGATEAGEKILEVPSGSTPSSVPATLPTASAQGAAGAIVPKGFDPGGGRGVPIPLGQLDVGSAADIGPAQAEAILRGLGHIRPGESMEAGLAKLHRGYTYRRGGGSLDDDARGWLMRELTLYREALARWSAYPEVSMRRTPHLLQAFIDEASRHMSHVPASLRVPLLRSMMVQESSLVHWRGYRPVVGGAGEVGLGQFMPATARGLGINPYDPRENVIGIALYIDKLTVARGGSVEAALASYNGGVRPPPQSWRYARSVLARAGQMG